MNEPALGGSVADDDLCAQGLSPGEITQCLQNVQSRNGLSPVLRSAVDASAEAVASQRGRVWALVKHYGVASVATMLLAYGYWAFRNKLIARAIAVRHASVVSRRTRRNTEMETVLTHLQEQRQQFMTVGIDSADQERMGMLMVNTALHL